MSELKKLEERIAKLTPEELKRFRAWFAEFDARAWDASSVRHRNILVLERGFQGGHFSE